MLKCIYKYIELVKSSEDDEITQKPALEFWSQGKYLIDLDDLLFSINCRLENHCINELTLPKLAILLYRADNEWVHMIKAIVTILDL